MTTSIEIPARYNGPPNSGNGGYSCGVLAALVDGPARVRLHVPPPLDVPLRLERSADGAVAMYQGETLVGSGCPATLDLSVPTPPTLAQARAASAGFPCYTGHAFPTCFVCGPERPHHDGLSLFPGPVPERDLYACSWEPAADLRDAKGNIRQEILWSALDCPGYFAAMGEQLRPALLGELVGELHAPVAADQALVVFAWPLGSEGRKFYAGTAVATAAGTVVASARTTWIELAA